MRLNVSVCSCSYQCLCTTLRYAYRAQSTKCSCANYAFPFLPEHCMACSLMYCYLGASSVKSRVRVFSTCIMQPAEKDHLWLKYVSHVHSANKRENSWVHQSSMWAFNPCFLALRFVTMHLHLLVYSKYTMFLTLPTIDSKKFTHLKALFKLFYTCAVRMGSYYPLLSKYLSSWLLFFIFGRLNIWCFSILDGQNKEDWFTNTIVT